MTTEIPIYYPKYEPIYDMHKTYGDNAEYGPFLDETVTPIPQRIWAPKEDWIDFLGYKVASPLGVPAGPLLNSRWTNLAAKVGFDVITYKTIRSAPHAGHSHPNVMYIDTDGSLTRERWTETLKSSKLKPDHMEKVAITNSFGMPSKDAAFLQADIKTAMSGLSDGQVMIVSVVGSACDKKDFVEDYIRTAKLAVSAGAQIIEANFSCPNVVTGEGKIYSNPDSVREIVSSMSRELGHIPLIVKVGVFDEKEQMKKVFKAASEAGAKGICGINTLSMKVIDETGSPALGPTRLHSGICGGPIREAAIDWVTSARHIIDENHLPLALAGCGGIVQASQFDDFLKAGAEVAMTATGMMWDPFIALRYHASHVHQSKEKN